ncbi:MAG: aminoacyl-tRNA hydrolase [Rickettsiales bacterium]
MYLIAGLGNDFEQYKYTRHNIGFLILDELLNKFNLSFAYKKNLKSHIISSKLGYIFNAILNSEEKIIFAKPNQYMNNSGLSILSLISEYKPKKIIILHDELDLKPYEIKYKLGGSDNGHNGLRSISSKIGTNYYRIRIGIGRPEINQNNQTISIFENIKKKQNNIKPDISSYVLSNFNKDEIKNYYLQIEKILFILEEIIKL